MDTCLAFAITSAMPLPFRADTTMHNLQEDEKVSDG